jgi:predicted nucleotidyltransferase
VSFGIPFFQELIESQIRYLPLYPDEEGIIFNKSFLKGARNILTEMLPHRSSLSDTLRLIDVPASKEGMVLQVLMNAELDEALAILTDSEPDRRYPDQEHPFQEEQIENYWRWRQGMAEQIASELDCNRYGVAGIYLFGSTKNGTAGPSSDIDMLVHFRGNKEQRKDLNLWFEGWSLCLDEMNYLKTGYRSRGLLDVHIVTDEDIAQKTSYAVKIGAVTDAARPLKTKTQTATKDQ